MGTDTQTDTPDTHTHIRNGLVSIPPQNSISHNEMKKQDGERRDIPFHYRSRITQIFNKIGPVGLALARVITVLKYARRCAPLYGAAARRRAACTAQCRFAACVSRLRECMCQVSSKSVEWFMRYLHFCKGDLVTLTFGQGHYMRCQEATQHHSGLSPKISSKSVQ